ncbi:hypothetical protein [Vulcanisaeta thermophila]|uniref:hypothetical protein n=1 Tax=Vulcanisaeta thermophila TaxID=867917 RepID=UPI0008537296|nr:hypothetical protein [Vulcanisaeta thermophila]
MMSMNDVTQAVFAITRLVTVPINIHAIIYLTGRDWSSLDREDGYYVYRTTDTQRNPVTVKLRVRQVQMGDRNYYEVYGLEVSFKYMGKDYVALYPVDTGAIIKTKVNDAELMDAATRIGGEVCMAVLSMGQVPSVCKQIGKFYLVITRAGTS